MHTLIRIFDHTELWRVCASSITIDLHTLKFGLASTRCLSMSERVTNLHILLPAITCGTLARAHELKKVTIYSYSKMVTLRRTYKSNRLVNEQ